MTFERAIAAPPAKVWSVATDIEGFATRFEKVDAVEVLTEGEFRIGTWWRETRTVYGRPATTEIIVTECSMPRRMAAEAHVGARAVTELDLIPNQTGTHTLVKLSFQTVGGGPGYRVLEFLYRRRIRRCVTENNTQDLADLARACEP